MLRIIKSIKYTLLFLAIILILPSENKAFPLPTNSLALSKDNIDGLETMGKFLVSPELYPCWESIINVLQATTAALFVADSALLVADISADLNNTLTESKRVIGSVSLAELSAIQVILAAYGFKKWYYGTQLDPGAKYYHAITTTGGGVGLTLICAGIAADDFWTTAAGNMLATIFFGVEAATTQWRAPGLHPLTKWQIIGSNIGGMLFTASSFVSFGSLPAADATLTAGLLLYAASILPSALFYFFKKFSLLRQK